MALGDGEAAPFLNEDEADRPREAQQELLAVVSAAAADDDDDWSRTKERPWLPLRTTREGPHITTELSQK